MTLVTGLELTQFILVSWIFFLIFFLSFFFFFPQLKDELDQIKEMINWQRKLQFKSECQHLSNKFEKSRQTSKKRFRSNFLGCVQTWCLSTVPEYNS